MKRQKEEESYDEIAEYYDLFYTGCCGDKAFFVNEGKKAKKVLEIGCGTARILLEIAKNKVDSTGLDVSAGMLDIARKKADEKGLSNICFHKGDMRNFKLNKKFDLITIPYSAFCHMLTLDDQKKALKNIRRHLTKNGRLIFSIFLPSIEIIYKRHGKYGRKRTNKDPDTGDTLNLYERPFYNTISQQIYLDLKIERIRKKKIIKTYKSKIHLKYSFYNEMTLLLEASGYKLLDVYGSFRKKKLQEKDNHMVFIVKPR